MLTVCNCIVKTTDITKICGGICVSEPDQTFVESTLCIWGPKGGVWLKKSENGKAEVSALLSLSPKSPKL